jgi:hypothetical protein
MSGIEERIARLLEREFDPTGSRTQFAVIASVLVAELLTVQYGSERDLMLSGIGDGSKYELARRYVTAWERDV